MAVLVLFLGGLSLKSQTLPSYRSCFHISYIGLLLTNRKITFVIKINDLVGLIYLWTIIYLSLCVKSWKKVYVKKLIQTHNSFWKLTIKAEIFQLYIKHIIRIDLMRIRISVVNLTATFVGYFLGTFFSYLNWLLSWNLFWPVLTISWKKISKRAFLQMLKYFFPKSEIHYRYLHLVPDPATQINAYSDPQPWKYYNCR